MGFTKKKSRNVKKIILRSFIGIVGITVIGGLILLRPPIDVNASIDPGLDSGNAVVDRTTVPGQTILIYTTAGNSTFKAPAGVTSVRVLVIGGGGGGGIFGGGGGAGGVIANSNVAVTPGVTNTTTVGGGGIGATSRAVRGSNGSNSVFGSLTAIGGGGGGSDNSSTYVAAISDGGNGGSGGGAGDKSPSVGGTGTAGQGNNGGNATAITHGAGGGGAGGAGQSGGSTVNLTDGGNGGLSITNDITGSSVAYAGGGGAQYGGVGGGGGAGNGATANFNPGTAAAANTGSGGGGGANGNGGNGGSGIVIIRFATKTTPDVAGVPGLVAWYKADSAGNSNAQWNDSSTLGYNLTQGTAANQPVFTTNSLNFNPAYVFDGTDDVFSMTSGIGGNESMSAFYAATSTDAAGGDRYFNEFGDDRPSITIYNGKPRLYVRDTSSIDDVYATDASLKPHVFSFVSPNSGGTKIISVDNNEQAKAITGTYPSSGGNANNTFGGKNVSAGTSWKGPIGEALYFNRQLTQPERQRINSYLAIKYGVTLDQGTSGTAYLDSATATVWPADATYKNNIAGIGRDDASTLNQKQSKGSGEVTMGTGMIAATNQDNTNNFGTDKTFVMWGDNNASLAQNTSVPGTSLTRVDRVWKTVVTNSPGQQLIRIPSSMITRGVSPVVFISNDGTFGASTTRTPMTLNGSNYEAFVSFTGTQYFTFGAQTGSDLEFVSKTATDISNTPIAAYTPGQPLEYHLTVQNNGPEDAGLVTVTDVLPAGIVPTAGGSSGDGWGCGVSGQTVNCTRQALANGAIAPEIIIEATIASSVSGQKVNQADVTVASDPDLTNNSASVTLDASLEADLSITKASTDSPSAGQPMTYELKVTNTGPSDVTTFTITDTLDSSLTYQSSSANLNCSGAPALSCAYTGSPVVANSTITASLTVLVDGGYAGGDIANTATVVVPNGVTDPNLNNNSSTDNTNVTVNTDLAISKSHTGNFIAGQNNTFTISATNNGPSDAPSGSITISDTLDEDFAYVSANGGATWSCTHNNGTVNCTYNDILTATSTTPDITLTVLVDPIAKGTTTNIATVSGTTPDPVPGNNSATDTITIVAEADLALTKTHVGTTFVSGQQGQYTLSVVNNGPSADAPSYTITDALPTGLTFAGTAAGSATICSSGDNINVSCTGGGLGAGDPAQITTIIVNVDPGATLPITNSATVMSDPSVTDPTLGNNTDDDTVNIEPNADLTLAKTPPNTMTAGSSANYLLGIDNLGPSNVSSFTITDTLDPNLTYQSSSPNICSAVGQTVTCNGGSLNSGVGQVITVTVAVASTATTGATISNTATITPPAGVNDPDMTNNTDTVTNTMAASADLVTTKTHTGNFTVGANGTFTINVTNNGPSDASTVTVTDVLPDGLTYVSATSLSAGCGNAGQTVTCTIGPALSSGQSVDITLVVAVDPDVTAATIDNTASASSATPDPTPADSIDTDTVTIDPAEANLTATKNAQGSLTAGRPVTYRFEITNDGGPDNAGNVTISDALPSYLSYQSFSSVSGGTWNCSASGQDVTCILPILNVGDTAVVDVTVMVAQDASNPAENNATVTFNGTDTSANNPSTSDPVSYAADLEVKLTHDSETYESGEKVTYTYTAINHGPSRAEDVVLTDTLPEGLTFESIVAVNAHSGNESLLAKVIDTVLGSATASAAPNTPFDCSNSGQDVTCNASELGVGTYTITMTALISSSFTGSLTSVAQITSATFDPNTANNSSTDTIADVRAADGLAGTGQNLLLWIASAIIVMTSTAGLLAHSRRKVQV